MSFIGGLVVIGLAIALALAGMFYVRSRISLADLESHNDVAGSVYGTISVMFGVLAAFVVVIVWGEFQDARHYMENEASALVDIAYLAGGLPEDDRQAVRAAVLRYLEHIVDEEWPALGRGERVPIDGGAAMRQLREQVVQISPQSEREHAILMESLSRLSAFSDARRGRLLETTNIVPGLVWAVMLLGAICTIGFPFFFGVRSVRAQALMTVVLTAMSAALLYLVLELDEPFAGTARLAPEAFQQAIGTVSQLNAQ